MYSTANQCPSGGRGSASEFGLRYSRRSLEVKNDQNLTPLLHSSLQPFLSLLVTTLSSAFDSDRAPERRGGKNKVFLYTLLCRQPLSPQYRILIRINKPQIPQLNLYILSGGLLECWNRSTWAPIDQLTRIFFFFSVNNFGGNQLYSCLSGGYSREALLYQPEPQEPTVRCRQGDV